jgi:hypothetical protein
MTDSGTMRDKRRQLKHREIGHVRTVPCPPELTALLQDHLKQFGTAPNGRLFRGERNAGELPKLTIVKAWRRARALSFTPEVRASPLAAVPYDLRHAALSTWLNAGIPPAEVAAWAGHSVDVLLKIYAKCLTVERSSSGTVWTGRSGMIKRRRFWRVLARTVAGDRQQPNILGRTYERPRPESAGRGLLFAAHSGGPGANRTRDTRFRRVKFLPWSPRL